MSESHLDAAEAARNLLIEVEAFCRDARRVVTTADLLSHAATSFGRGLVEGRPPDGRDLLERYGRAVEALSAAASALDGFEANLEGLRFVFTDEPEPDARLRARAIDELREFLARRRLPLSS